MTTGALGLINICLFIAGDYYGNEEEGSGEPRINQSTAYVRCLSQVMYPKPLSRPEDPQKQSQCEHYHHFKHLQYLRTVVCSCPFLCSSIHPFLAGLRGQGETRCFHRDTSALCGEAYRLQLHLE